jgi:hypothetical protein
VAYCLAVGLQVCPNMPTFSVIDLHPVLQCLLKGSITSLNEALHMWSSKLFLNNLDRVETFFDVFQAAAQNS